MAKQKRVTSYDVAREAGVSQSAVSRVFRPGFSVSEKTRTKVLDTAKKMGYKPNAIARMLITQQSGMIAVIVSSRANVNYPEVLSQLNKYIAQQNKRVLLFTLDSADDLAGLLENIWTYQVDGVIALAAHFEQSSLEQLEQHQIPVVLYNRNVPDANVNSVCCSHERGIKQLINILHEGNHKSYLVIAGPTDSDVANERRDIACQYLKQLGHDNVPVVYGDYSYESGRKAFAKWTGANGVPDAVICSNDIMAIGVIDEAKEHMSISVPDDLSVVGFDGVSPAAWFSYQVTTIRQPLDQLTKAAVDILMERINNPDSPPETRVLTGALIEGNSTKPRQ
ncbi:LacI family DNA-binding transcriptional regulator [Endozoicomonas sp. G2_1]|uniref:LacI family DNA-binding transcriptional regulator n=1 Tax=Endozoicomonas sp. G2_1 TaxID=2821091 RepID=UPI001ADB69C2|nr:LacI family DNA-binding transcriptional regulator [Endozoicomonas sp. G2_1]MBO9490421.1 LacI family DNA-binding transcriptional regulator [Endozoicomonas sp. G2_1]